MSIRRGTIAMDRYVRPFSIQGLVVLLAAIFTISNHSEVVAERVDRPIYNPFSSHASVSRHTETGAYRSARHLRVEGNPTEVPNNEEPFDEESLDYQERPVYEEPPVDQSGYDEYGECDAYCLPEPTCSFDDVCCGDPVGFPISKPRTRFYTGFEATFVKPRFSDNVGFTVMEADGVSFESFSDTQLDYDLEFTPRVFVGWQHGDGVGLRATWWQFDHSAANSSASPPANGFGRIDHPPFGNVDISTVIPTDTFSAATVLNAYSIDLEATKQTSFCSWDLGVSCGVRYAYTDQSYRAQLRDTNNVLRGQIDFRHSLEGFGPTISLDAYRPFGSQSGIFCKARGSVLFGDGESRLIAGEDLDLSTPLNTTRTTSRDDLLSIGEIQLGYRWQGHKMSRYAFRPFCSIAMEGQIWNGAGNATSEEATLGFFGFNAGGGLSW